MSDLSSFNTDPHSFTIDYIKFICINHYDCRRSFTNEFLTDKIMREGLKKIAEEFQQPEPIKTEDYRRLAYLTIGLDSPKINPELVDLLLHEMRMVATKTNRLSDYTTNLLDTELERDPSLQEQVDALILKNKSKNIEYLPYLELTKLYQVISGVSKSLIGAIPTLFKTISDYVSSHDTLENLLRDEPNIENYFTRLVNLNFSVAPLKEGQEVTVILDRSDATIYTTFSKEDILKYYNPKTAIMQAIYSLFGYFSTNLLHPTTIFTLKTHVLNYHTLNNLNTLDSRLYRELSDIAYAYKYSSLKDLLNSEGFDYEEFPLKLERVELPCQDGSHVMVIQPNWASFLVLDKTHYSICLRNKLFDRTVVFDDNTTTPIYIEKGADTLVFLSQLIMDSTVDNITGYMNDLSASNIRIRGHY